MRAIIGKALAADLSHRYATAADFENDLRAFVENRRTIAEAEHAPSWDSNATIERPGLKIVGMRTGRRIKVAGMLRQLNHMVWALVAGLVAGLLILMPAGFMVRFWMNSAPLRAAQDYTQASAEKIASDWQLYKDLDQQNAFLHGFSPIDRVRQPLRARLLAAADDVIDSYRNSSDGALDKFDWEKARLCLRRALELQPSRDVSGKAALCEGYAAVVRDGIDTAGAQADFERAARLLPRAADPHLALARIEVYVAHNAGLALAQFEEAEHLGHRLGPRENEQLGDAYLWRAEQELREFIKENKTNARAGRRVLLAAQRDFERAHERYEPIAGYSKVSESLDRMGREETVAEQWEARQKRAEQEKARPSRHRKLYSRR
jgi:hypothetical protein